MALGPHPIHFMHKTSTDTWRNQIYLCKNCFRLISLKDKENCYPFQDSKKHSVYIKRQKHRHFRILPFLTLPFAPETWVIIRFCEGVWGSQSTHLKTIRHRLLATHDPTILKPNSPYFSSKHQRWGQFTLHLELSRNKVKVFQLLKDCLLSVFHVSLNPVARVMEKILFKA